MARFGTSTGLLVKLLDAAERLPVHAHPDRAFAREAFDSPFGKTEAWIVLDTREAPRPRSGSACASASSARATSSGSRPRTSTRSWAR